MVEETKQEELSNESNESTTESVLETEKPEETKEQAPQEDRQERKAGGSDTGETEGDNDLVQNWKLLRQKNEREKQERLRIQKERDELAAKLESQQQNRQVTNEDDDDLVERRHLRQTEQKLQQVEARLIDSEIRAKFPDWSEVVNEDTIAMLKDADPDLAESIASNRNVMGQAASAYRAIKMYGFAKPSYKKEKEVVAKNAAKPRPSASVNPQQGDSPLSRANEFSQGLTDEVKQQIWDEMQQIING